MPEERPTKRARHAGSGFPSEDVSFRSLGDGVWQVVSERERRLAVGNGDFNKAFMMPGTAIVDNSADLGRFRNGVLLQSNSKFYLGFVSPSRYSTMQLASSLQMFHDLDSLELSPFLEQLDMTKHATGAKPGMHVCIRLDFSPQADDYFSGRSETLEAVAEFINRVVCSAIAVFRERYEDILPASYPAQDSTRSPWEIFLGWLAAVPEKKKLFVAVHHPHQILERPLDAAVWAERKWSQGDPTALESRLDILRRLVLTPLWSNLSSNNGVVKKLVIVGPHFVRGLYQPQNLGDFPGLPSFLNLSGCGALHGFSPSQIRVAYSMKHSTMPTAKLAAALLHCNLVTSVKNPSSPGKTVPIYTKESLHSVLLQVSSQPSLLDARDHGMLYKAYLDATHERAARMLYPLLLRNSQFRKLARDLLLKVPKKQAIRHDTEFSFAQLINPTPPRTELFVRLFALGLVSWMKIATGSKGEVQDVYTLSGGCARALVQKLFDDTAPEKYKQKYQSRQPSTAPADRNLRKANLKVDVSAFDIEALTEESIATLILDHFRPLTHYKQLPRTEDDFQRTMVLLHRAALLRQFGDAAFVNNVQIEVAYRHRGNLFGDLILRMVIGGVVHIIIHEYKSFDPKKTMNETHKSVRGLKSQELRDRWKKISGAVPDHLTESAWSEAMKYFLLEVGSIKDLPLHWYVDKLRKKVPCTLSVDDICALFFKKSIGREVPKVAVVVAEEAVTQVAKYRDVGTLGVADHLAVIDYNAAPIPQGAAAGQSPAAGGTATDLTTTLASRITFVRNDQQGWADKRITDLGPGLTKIIAFAIVNVAGALVFSKKLEEKTIARELGLVDGYPWEDDPTQQETTAVLEAKRAYSNKHRR